MRCKKIKKNGKQCKAYAFPDGSGMCIFHSTTSQAKEARKVKPTTKIKMIKILEKELKNLDSVEDVIARTAEKRRTIQLIQELKEEKLSPQEEEKEPEGESIEEKLKRWKKKDTQ